MEWEFQAPKFWDLSETIPQERPSDSWFCTKNVSNPSFEAPKKRRTLRIFKYSSKSAAKKKLQEPIQKRESVFERLSRKSTISFSRKTNQPLTPEQRQIEAHHAILNDLEDNLEQELIVQSSRETVGERIARLEGTYLGQGKPFGLGKKTIKLKQNINHSSHKQPAQTQTLRDELQKYYDIEERTGETVFSSISQYSQDQPSPVSSHTPIVGQGLSPDNISTINNEGRSEFTHFSPRREQIKAASASIPIQNATPIRKHTSSKSNSGISSEKEKLASAFFEGLLKLAQKAKEERAKRFFDKLLKSNATDTRRHEMQARQESMLQQNNTDEIPFSPRKRRGSSQGSEYSTTEINKRSRIDV